MALSRWGELGCSSS